MINTQATGSNPLGAIEITPLIDIVFIVIVFFAGYSKHAIVITTGECARSR
jgi:biopolymer transport protein ExbD